MNDSKIAPDPQNGTHSELLALCLEHIKERDILRERLHEREETVIRQSCALQSLERQLTDVMQALGNGHAYAWKSRLAQLVTEAHDGYTD